MKVITVASPVTETNNVYCKEDGGLYSHPHDSAGDRIRMTQLIYNNESDTFACLRVAASILQSKSIAKTAHVSQKSKHYAGQHRKGSVGPKLDELFFMERGFTNGGYSQKRGRSLW